MNYKELPDDTRIWIYQANRQLSETEIDNIRKLGNSFINEWTAHGTKLKAAFEVFHNQFVIFFADEDQAKASGCSIDKSVHFIKKIEDEFDITLLDRDLVTYKEANKIITCTRNIFSELARNQKINGETIVFNNLINSKAELDNNWQVPMRKSWHRDLI